MKIADGRGKLVICKLLDRYVPRELTDRPGAGFGIPVGEWLRGPLKGWTDDLLSEERLRRGGLFDVNTIRRRYREQQSGHSDSTVALWLILMFESWLDAQEADACRARPRPRPAAPTPVEHPVAIGQHRLPVRDDQQGGATLLQLPESTEDMRCAGRSSALVASSSTSNGAGL